LDRLISFSAGRQVAIMCAEAKWWPFWKVTGDTVQYPALV
jgi:hypothetical protein